MVWMGSRVSAGRVVSRVSTVRVSADYVYSRVARVVRSGLARKEVIDSPKFRYSELWKTV